MKNIVNRPFPRINLFLNNFYFNQINYDLLFFRNGREAMVFGLNYLGIKKGSTILMPAYICNTFTDFIIRSGYKIRYVDINKDMNFDINIITNIFKSENIKAIIFVYYFGLPFDIIPLLNLCKKYNIKIIEDSADTLGAKINNKSTGIYSDISITSFYGSHIISCAGNGGMFLTSDKKLYERAKVLRSWGRMSTLIKDSENINKRLNIKLEGFDYDKKFVFSEVGYNFEPSEIGASFGLVQLRKFNKFNKIRNKNFKLHYEFFKNNYKFFITPKILKNIKTNFLAYPIIIKKNPYFKRKQLQIFLEKNSIQTRPIFTGNILRHPAFRILKSKRNKVNDFKNSDYIMKYGLLIGCHQGLKVDQIKYIHKKIIKFIKNNT